LDGKLVNTSYLTQPQASAVSILLTTIFKAALTASTGICFAQHLWFVLRGNAMPLATIEKLFILRTNLLALGDLRSTWRAPLLVSMALLVWCLGLATIYPPGALIVTFEAYTFTEIHNMPVMNPPIPRNLDFAQNDTFPTFATHYGDVLYTFDEANGTHGRGFGYSYVGQSKALLITKLFSGPWESLSNVASSILINNQVFSSLASPGENFTYHLQFRAPQFRCTVAIHNISVPLDGVLYNDGLVFESKWDSQSLHYSVKQSRYEEIDLRQDHRRVTNYNIELTEQTCEPVSMLYDVETSFSRGLRKIEHSCSDAEPFHNKSRILGPNCKSEVVLPAEPQVLHDWNQKVMSALPIVNQWALLDAMGALLVGTHYDGSVYTPMEECDEESMLEFGCVSLLGDVVIANQNGNVSRKFILHFRYLLRLTIIQPVY
jgi:hypothetical protein